LLQWHQHMRQMQPAPPTAAATGRAQAGILQSMSQRVHTGVVV
jgi:hypothetical protein